LRIIGIDPGYAIVGTGIVDYDNVHFKVVDHRAITTPAGMEFPLRLELIYHDLTDLLVQYRPDALAIEELFFGNNVTTGIDVAQARGVILLAAAAQEIPIYQYKPAEVKQAVVGYGRAEKKQVMEMTRILLGLAKIPRPDDVADALAIAICHAHCAGSARMRSLMQGRGR